MDVAEAKMVERLWLVCLSNWTKQDRAARLIDEAEDMVAVVTSNHSNAATDPLEQKFRTSGVYIKGRSGWIIDRLVQEAKPGRKAVRQLHTVFNAELPVYAEKYWLGSDGRIEKALLARGVVDHIKVDLAMLCGFNLWMEKFSPGATDEAQEIDLSKVLGFKQRRRLKVMVSNFDFPSRDRLELISGLSKRVQRSLQKLSPAGEIAYSSMTLALKKIIEKQHSMIDASPDEHPPAKKK